MAEALETKQSLKLDTLNDDCLVLVLKRITYFPDQLRAARVCRRFRDYFHKVWKRVAAYRSGCMLLMFVHVPNSEDRLFYLETMSLDIDMFKFSFSCLGTVIKHWSALGQLCFQNCHSFEITGPYLESDGAVDESDILTLHKYVPNLKYLRLNTYTNGIFLSRFQYIEEVHLCIDRELTKYRKTMGGYLSVNDLCAYCRNLRVLDIRPYRFINLGSEGLSRCVSLETLKLHFSNLKGLLAEIMMLPRLKTLTVYINAMVPEHIIPKEIYVILQDKAESLVGLRIDNNRTKLQECWDINLLFLRFNKLRDFAFIDWQGNAAMAEKYTRMTELRVLRLSKWLNLQNSMVMRFIKACKKLEHLEIKHCPLLSEALLYDMLRELNEQGRKEPLWVYYIGSGLTAAVEAHRKQWFKQHNVLALSRKSYPLVTFANEYFNTNFCGMEFQFDTAAEQQVPSEDSSVAVQ